MKIAARLLALVALLSTGVVGLNAQAAVYSTNYASAGAIICATDAVCASIANVQVGGSTYVWTASCASTPDGLFYIQPAGTHAGCFALNSNGPVLIARTGAVDQVQVKGSANCGTPPCFFRAYRDESSVNPGPAGAYTAFDSNFTLTGSNALNHSYGYECRQIDNSSGLLNLSGCLDSTPTLNGPVNLWSHIILVNPTGSGSASTVEGLLVQDQTFGALNYGVQLQVSAGTSVATSSAASISSTNLTVGGTITGVFASGQVLTGAGVTQGTIITGQTSGPTGGAGIYTLSLPSTVSSEAMTATANIKFNIFEDGTAANSFNGDVLANANIKLGAPAVSAIYGTFGQVRVNTALNTNGVFLGSGGVLNIAALNDAENAYDVLSLTGTQLIFSCGLTPTQCGEFETNGLFAIGDGTSSAFPALARSSTTLDVVLADNSGFAPLQAGTITGNALLLNGGVAIEQTVQNSEIVLNGGTTNNVDPEISLFGSAFGSGISGQMFLAANQYNFRDITNATVWETLSSGGLSLKTGSTYQINGTQISAVNLSNGVIGASTGAVVLASTGVVELKIPGVNINASAPSDIGSVTVPAVQWRIAAEQVTNCSSTPVAGQIALWTGANATGNQLTNATVLTANTSPSVVAGLTANGTTATTRQTATTVFVNLSVQNAAAVTCDIVMQIVPL